MGHIPLRSLLAIPNVTAHPSTASVPITVMLYNGPLPCGFNVPDKGLTITHIHTFKCSESAHNVFIKCISETIRKPPLVKA